MTKFTFYGGINEIGGNKILLEDNGRNLFLDFGFPYKRHKIFFEEYLNPRGGAGLLDPLVMGLIPPISGLYRTDLEDSFNWNRFNNDSRFRKLDNVDGVLLSHAHLDHSGHISLLRGDIPVYATSTSAFLAKAIQESGKSGLEQQICYFNPVEYGTPSGWDQQAYISVSSAASQQRQFRIGDIDPQYLSGDANNYWANGFWEKTSRSKDLDSRPFESSDESAFTLRCLPVDHSIPGACAWAIETDSGVVLYTGDLRLHGKRPHLTRSFIDVARHLKPKAVIIEGTNISRNMNITEESVYQKGLSAIQKANKLVIADFSPRDMDRLITFLNIAIETGRKLVILPKDAYLLKTLHLIDPAFPDIASSRDIRIYQKTTSSKYPAKWMVNLCNDYSDKIVLADDIHAAQDDFILCFSFFDLNELPNINPDEHGLYVFSSSEPHDEEQEIDFRRLHEWLKHFGFDSIGLPRETDGVWAIPESESGLHASGHACGADLVDIVKEINPEILIPVHSEKPGLYADYLRNESIDVKLPSPGGTIEL